MRTAFPLAFMLLLGATAPEAHATNETSSSLEAQTEGLVAKAPVHCLRRNRAGSATIVDERIILFRRSADLLYVNRLPAACPGLGVSTTLVSRSVTGDLCRGDLAEVANVESGAVVGRCALGNFVPYARAAR